VAEIIQRSGLLPRRLPERETHGRPIDRNPGYAEQFVPEVTNL
jgi:hypothetical protein